MGIKSKRKTTKEDIELGSGWSYFVENSAYERHLKEHDKEKEVNLYIKVKQHDVDRKYTN